MSGGKVPGPLDGAKVGPIDKGTLNRQPSQPPGHLGLRHRYHLPWELRSNRKLVEFNPDPGDPISGAERLRLRGLGYFDQHERWFEGFRLPKVSPILLLPNPDFQATPWENAYFGLTFVRSHPPSIPILNASNEVIGHVAHFRDDEIFVPNMLESLHLLDLDLRDLVAAGMPAFVRKKNPNPRFWSESSHPQMGYQLAVTAGGEVIAVLSARDTVGDAGISTRDFILTVVTIVDGAFLLRGLSAASRAALLRIDAQLAKRAMAAAERERLEAAGKLAAKGKDASPAAFARTQPVWPLAGKDASPFALAQPREALADTVAVPRPAGATLDTGGLSAVVRESDFAKRLGAMQEERFAEIAKARAARGSDFFATSGDGWMDEIIEISTRVEQKHFPNGLRLDP